MKERFPTVRLPKYRYTDDKYDFFYESTDGRFQYYEVEFIKTPINVARPAFTPFCVIHGYETARVLLEQTYVVAGIYFPSIECRFGTFTISHIPIEHVVDRICIQGLQLATKIPETIYTLMPTFKLSLDKLRLSHGHKGYSLTELQCIRRWFLEFNHCPRKPQEKRKDNLVRQIEGLIVEFPSRVQLV